MIYAQFYAQKLKIKMHLPLKKTKFYKLSQSIKSTQKTIQKLNNRALSAKLDAVINISKKPVFDTKNGLF